MIFERSLEDVPNCLPMTLVKLENLLCNAVGFERGESRAHARCFAAESTKECKLAWIAKLQGGSDVRLGHGLVFRPVALACEQLDPVHLHWIMLGSISGKDCKTSVETLGTATAMGV